MPPYYLVLMVYIKWWSDQALGYISLNGCMFATCCDEVLMRVLVDEILLFIDLTSDGFLDDMTKSQKGEMLFVCKQF